jgi:signal transduction histidine kinase
VRVTNENTEIIARHAGLGEVVFVRTGSGFLGDVFRASTLLPLAAFWGLSLVLALMISHHVVSPIQALSAKLPDFESTSAEPGGVPGLERADEIGHLARTLVRTHGRLREEQARREASERLALLGKMATGLAHEIRNPVAAVRLHAQLLEVMGGESARLIVSESEKIEGLVNQWMFLARPEPPSTRNQDLRGCLREIMAALEPAARHGGMCLVADLSEPLPCAVDTVRMGQVFRNLLMNAMHAMPDGGDVSIDGVVKEGRVLVTVRDNGEGFTDEALQRFGELFFSTKEGGMGVGLSVAGEIVRAHGGTLDVSNPPEGGAVARVSLPVSREPDKP